MDDVGASGGEAQQENLLKAKYGGLMPPKKHLLQRRGEEGDSTSGGKQFFDSGTYNMERQLRRGQSGNHTGEDRSVTYSFQSVSNGLGAGEMAPAHLRVHNDEGEQHALRPSRMGSSKTSATARNEP